MINYQATSKGTKDEQTEIELIPWADKKMNKIINFMQ